MSIWPSESREGRSAIRYPAHVKHEGKIWRVIAHYMWDLDGGSDLYFEIQSEDGTRKTVTEKELSA